MWMSRASKNASRARYAASQRTVHWVTAALVAVMLPMGFYMVHRYAATSYDAVTVQIYDVHKLLGSLFFGWWPFVSRCAFATARRHMIRRFGADSLQRRTLSMPCSTCC